MTDSSKKLDPFSHYKHSSFLGIVGMRFSLITDSSKKLDQFSQYNCSSFLDIVGITL
jgi:hypothetical protein